MLDGNFLQTQKQRQFAPGVSVATVTGPAFLDTDDHVEITKEVNFVSDSI